MFNHKFDFKQAFPMAGLFIVAGFVVVATYASGTFVAVEPESGSLSSGARQITDTNASGGQAVQFAAAPTPTPTPTPGTSPSGQAMPVGDLPGWKQIFADDFTKDAVLGSWGSDCDGSKIVYTGATGTKWKAYPKCYLDTYDNRPYRSDAVLSVSGGLLDFYLHNVDGVPAGANPGPVLNNTTGSMYQTYGRYSARFRLTATDLSEYYTAWLLWPQTEADWQCAESDFPEGSLSDLDVSAFAHYGCSGSQDFYQKVLANRTDWHTFTQEWAPGYRKYYVDGTLIGTSTNQVYTGPMRWQLQTETKGAGTHAGHLQVDWVVVYGYQP